MNTDDHGFISTNSSGEEFILRSWQCLVETIPMSRQLPAPSGSNPFERIKRVNAEENESWSAGDLARVLESTGFRNFNAVIAIAREACASGGHAVSDHFVETRGMVNLGSGALRPIGDWKEPPVPSDRVQFYA